MTATHKMAQGSVSLDVAYQAAAADAVKGAVILSFDGMDLNATQLPA